MSARDLQLPLATADRLVRVLVAAKAQALEPNVLLEALSHLGDEPNELFAGLDHSFTHLTVQGRWPSSSDQSADLLSFHARAFPEQHARLAGLRERTARVRLVELETAAGASSLGCMISSVGPGPASDDVAWAARAAGLDERAEDALDAVARTLASSQNGACDAVSDRRDVAGRDSFSLRFARRNRDPGEQAATEAAILGAAGAVGVCEPHREFARKTALLLAKSNVCLVSVTAGEGRVHAELTLDFVEVSWESALRLVRGFSDDPEPGKRLGGLAGIANRDSCMVRMVLGAGDLPGLVVWTAI